MLGFAAPAQLKWAMFELSKAKILGMLTNPNITLDLFDVIDSTNKYASLQPHTNEMHVCVAEQQTGGKGRNGRVWHSPFGQNIYFSCTYVFQQPTSALSSLSLVVSVIVADVLKKFGANELKIKWPNDILHQQQKLAGILIDVTQQNKQSRATIGVGINVNMLHATASEITQEWTSLIGITEKEHDRNIIIAELINQLIVKLAQFNQLGFAPFIEPWRQLDYLKNKFITVHCGARTTSGEAIGIDDRGALLLKQEDGSIETILSGEASLSQ